MTVSTSNSGELVLGPLEEDFLPWDLHEENILCREASEEEYVLWNLQGMPRRVYGLGPSQVLIHGIEETEHWNQPVWWEPGLLTDFSKQRYPIFFSGLFVTHCHRQGILEIAG